MNVFTAKMINRFASLTEEEFHCEEKSPHMLAELMKNQQILQTAKELLSLNSTEVFQVDEVAEIFEEKGETLLGLLEENRQLLTLDGATDYYLSVRAVFRLATLLPQNPIAQECVCQLMNIALR